MKGGQACGQGDVAKAGQQGTNHRFRFMPHTLGSKLSGVAALLLWSLQHFILLCGWRGLPWDCIHPLPACISKLYSLQR